MKILISAIACEPNKGSEPEVGWKWATTLSKLGHEVYVITRKNNKENIENFLSKKKIPNLNFIYFDFPDWILNIIKGKSKRKVFSSKNKTSIPYTYYFFWHIAIFFATKSIVKKIKFDFIHHVTFVSVRFPNLLCLHKIPFIFGPISGGDKIPNHLRGNYSIGFKLKEFLRDLSNKYIKISPLMNITFSKSYKIFVTSKETKKLIPFKYHNKTEELLAIGVDNFHDIQNNNANKSDKNFNICFAGNFINLKGLSIAMKTFLHIKKTNTDVIFTIIGSGPMELELKNMAKKYGIDKSINWPGRLKREELFNEFFKSDLLLMPSLRDSGGFVVLEAMSCGLPVATLDIGGPGTIVNNECGIKVDVNKKNENEISLALASEIIDLVNNNEKLNYKKTKSLERVKEFSWDKKVSIVYNI